MKLELYPEGLQPYVQAVDATLRAATGLPPIVSDRPLQDWKIYYQQRGEHPTILLATVGPQGAIEEAHPRNAIGFIVAPKLKRGAGNTCTPHFTIALSDGTMVAAFYQDGSDSEPAHLVNLTNDPGALETTVLPWVTRLVEESRMGPLPSG